MTRDHCFAIMGTMVPLSEHCCATVGAQAIVGTLLRSSDLASQRNNDRTLTVTSDHFSATVNQGHNCNTLRNIDLGSQCSSGLRTLLEQIVAQE